MRRAPSSPLRPSALGLLVAGAVAVSPALAATEAEWAAFRAEVEAACLAAATGLFVEPRATVDPFGSESYGLALIEGPALGADIEIRAICVFDKVTRTVEIGGELPAGPAAAGGEPAWTPALADCDPACETALEALAPADAAAIRGLPQTIAATLAETSAIPRAGHGEADTVVARVLAAVPATAGTVVTGERACTVYWYGFLDEASRVVGHHRCRIDRAADGSLTVRKLTGEMLTAELVPLAGGLWLAKGQTFLEDQVRRPYDPARPDNPENPNFGNYAGLAFADGGALILVDADMHGFGEPDPTWFSVLAIE